MTYSLEPMVGNKDSGVTVMHLEGPLNTVNEYMQSIKDKYEHDWSFQSGDHALLSDLYTDPLIVEKIQNISFENISVDKLFQSNVLMTVVLHGDSGSGKSFIAQKMLLDWASKAASSIDFSVVFYLRCEELMFIEQMNLSKLLSSNCSLTPVQISKMLQHFPEKLLFIVDGFDHLRLTQDIYDMSELIDPLQKTLPEVIVCALLRRFLVPESTLLVTTRTKNTVNKLLNGQQCVTEILGFSEKMVKMYFQTFFSKEYESLKANETVFTACSSPVIRWIISEMLRVGANIKFGLETTTSIYIDFVCTLLEHHSQGLSRSVPTLLRSLGQLAERGMLETRVLFDEKSVNEMVSGTEKLFLRKRTVCQETMFGFMHRSFQEFFTALYFVLLDEEESQRKVKELLYTVERGWTLSCWPDPDFSMADVEVRQSEFLQPVILFLCGLCWKDLIPSFFEKHNMAVSVNIETHLKEWINKCSQRYQNEHLLFILHCLFELHQKSFTAKVLQRMILMDLSNMSLKTTDCWVLKHCLESSEHISNLKLQVTSDNLKMLHPALYKCKELWLLIDHISDCVVDLISAPGKQKILKKLNIKKLENGGSFFHLEITVSVRERDITLSFSRSMFTSSITELTLTSPHSVVSIIKWMESQNKQSSSYINPEEEKDLMFLKSLSGLKKVCLHVSNLNDTFACELLSLIQACSSLTQLWLSPDIKKGFSISDRKDFRKHIQSLKKSLNEMRWTLTFWGNSVLIKPNEERFTEKLQTKTDMGASPLLLTSEVAEVFTPQLIEMNRANKHKITYRFVCPHAGQFQCSLTSLVFVMDSEGEVQYKVDSWDPRLLDGLGQMQPAGPLYDIDCINGSISNLHLPHCETFSGENKDCLAVAHFTVGGIEMMQPLKVTETHVVIDIRDLSLFGLLKKIFSGSPIDAQVLLFLRPLICGQKNKILDVHLLPKNVPVSEVQCCHQDKAYIETSSKCRLFPHRLYSLCCQPEECEVQPTSEIFEHNNFGPNYHPTFEVFLEVDTEEVRLGILDEAESRNVVWNKRRILLTGQGSQHKRKSGSEFVDALRDKLIQRVSSVMAIADSLKSKRMITDELYNKVEVSDTDTEKMRRLFKGLDSGGASVKAEFYRLLMENEPHLVDELESGHSGSSRPQ
ncbi:NACHT, LRR and PYD domains-containing protein 1 homolog isoform X2 [Danio rerio]|nr:NACHT, LRR and PYD domains-containing protein 1b allele 2 [Danio rerio]|eukprot:XP_017207673.1 NACHT, LRR and PYD domains-containing protein 1b allele 2 [Danio rerio]